MEETTQVLITNEWINKLSPIQIMKYHSAIKRNEDTWDNLDELQIHHAKKADMKGHIWHDSCYMKCPELANPEADRSGARRWAQEGLGSDYLMVWATFPGWWKSFGSDTEIVFKGTRGDSRLMSFPTWLWKGDPCLQGYWVPSSIHSFFNLVAEMTRSPALSPRALGP